MCQIGLISLMLIGAASNHAFGSEAISEIPFANLEKEFEDPPEDARAWCYWWWLDGNATKEGVTLDLEAMKRQGIGGALLFDAGDGGPAVPQGPPFMGDEWRELYKHAVKKADRSGITLSVNLCSGWNAGGPWVGPEHAMKRLVSAKTEVKGPGRISVTLPKPKSTRGFYRDTAVLAALNFRKGAIDVSKFVNADGQLVWDAPDGNWTILRFGYTLSGRKTVAVGSGPSGLEIDPLSAEAMDAHFAETGAKLIADAGPLAGKVLQYFHIDSWEIGQPTWTPIMREEFKNRRGYDPLFWLPAFAGYVVEDDKETQRFMRDFRLTVSDLVADNYYGRLNKLAQQGGLKGAHSEAGGPVGGHKFWGEAGRTAPLRSFGAGKVDGGG